MKTEIPEQVPQNLDLWNIQPRKALDSLLAVHEHVARPDFALHWGEQKNDSWGFRHAYACMTKEMQARLPFRKDGDYFLVSAWTRMQQCNKDDSADRRSGRGTDPSDVLLHLRAEDKDPCLWRIAPAQWVSWHALPALTAFPPANPKGTSP